MEKTVQFRLEDFEGPLDLLLTLVQKNKKSIYDINILELIDQYLAVMDEAGPEEMERTSAFITMAARLVQMKSALLLPRTEDAERLREELTGLLVEYSACKRVAQQLREMAEGVYIVAREPMALEPDRHYKGTHTVAELVAAFSGILGRASARRMPRAERFDDIVARPFVSVTGRVIHLLRGLKTGTISRLQQLFAGCRSRSETVATFLALLELIRGSRVLIDDAERLQLSGARARQKNAEK